MSFNINFLFTVLLNSLYCSDWRKPLTLGFAEAKDEAAAATVVAASKVTEAATCREWAEGCDLFSVLHRAAMMGWINDPHLTLTSGGRESTTCATLSVAAYERQWIKYMEGFNIWK